MMVLIDTCVWSASLRRSRDARSPLVHEVENLVSHGHAVMLGLVRQELLSGIKSSAQYEHLRESLRAFPDVDIETEDHELAAAFFNRCRTKGIHGSAIDYLLAAVASRRDLPIFTTDADFTRYAKVLGLTLHELRRR